MSVLALQFVKRDGRFILQQKVEVLNLHGIIKYCWEDVPTEVEEEHAGPQNN